MSDVIAIQPMPGFRTSIRPPGRKSLTNRALLLAALSEGRCRISHPLIADDTRVMLDALASLGFAVERRELDGYVDITGASGAIPTDEAELMLGNAGTATRFLTAAVCLGEGEYAIDGVSRMRQRPIGQLIEPLRRLGATIDCLGEDGYPPLTVTSAGLRGGELAMPTTLSSQYISALLQIGPYCEGGLTLRFDGPVTSRPYVVMTLRLMQHFGVTAYVDDAFTRIDVPAGHYSAVACDVEPDASSASYFLAAAALLPDSACTIEGLGRRSLQGDVRFADLLHEMGAGMVFGDDFITVMSPTDGRRLSAIDVDMNDIPDVALTLAAMAPLVEGTTVIRNVGNLRVKETDRMAALQTELTRVGAAVTIDGDDLHIEQPVGGRVQPAVIETYDDHRIAMSFAVLGLAAEGIEISDPACVNKTYPGFFDQLRSLSRS